MISDDLLDILRCPLSRSRLRAAEQDLIARINCAIQRGQICNRAARTLEEVLEAGLVDESESLLYPVVNGIPCLLVEEAIELTQLTGIEAASAEGS